MEFHFLYDIIKKYLDDTILDLKLCSRLTWKNNVFYCRTKKNEYAIKIFKPHNRVLNRYKIERYMLSEISNISKVETPKVLVECEYENYKIIIMEWIKGISIKSSIDNNKLIDANIKLLSLFIKNMEDVWNYNYKNKEIEKVLSDGNSADLSSIYERANISAQKLFEFLYTKIDESIDEIKEYYYQIANTNNSSKMSIINSDISLHEVIINNNKMYWIDFEDYKIGDPNNDLAGIFYSASNTIYNNSEDIDKLLLLISNNKYYNKKMFLFYLIERVMCAYYLNYSNTSKEEISFYISFIKSNISELE